MIISLRYAEGLQPKMRKHAIKTARAAKQRMESSSKEKNTPNKERESEDLDVEGPNQTRLRSLNSWNLMADELLDDGQSDSSDIEDLRGDTDL